VQWCRTSWNATLSPASEPESSATSFPNLIRTLVHSGLPSETALSEAKENLGPGTDTTSATLGHILWALAHNPRYQNALYQDLAAVSFTTDMTTLEGIPRLQACVKEGIRWAATAAAMLPRIVPSGGIELHGTFIPEGVSANSAQYDI
jgi:cytochrome P450